MNCRFCTCKCIDIVDESMEVEIKYECKLSNFLWFKESTHVTYGCPCAGIHEECEVLKLCRMV